MLKSLRSVSSVIIISCFISAGVYAQEASYSAMQQDGFSDEAELLKSMTPEQRAEVMRQAAAKQKELQTMPPEKIQALDAQLHSVHNTLYVDKIDPAKLDVSRSKSTADTAKDMSLYQKKYAAGKITNSAVKPINDNGQN